MNPVHISHSTYLRSVRILFSHLHLLLLSDLLPSLVLPTKILRAFLVSPMRGRGESTDELNLQSTESFIQ